MRVAIITENFLPKLDGVTRTFTETFGQVVLEAMASGLPVVGLQAEGICDLVSEDQTGLLTQTQGLSEHKLIQHYQRNLHHLITEPQTRLHMREAALVAASKRSWYAAMEHLVYGYEEVLARHNQELIVA